MATTAHEAGRRLALDEIRVPENVRALDDCARPGARRIDHAAGHARPSRRPRRRRRLRARRRLSPDRRRPLARPGRRPGRRPRRRDRGRRPRGREHHAQAAQPLRGGQGGPSDARPRPDRGRRRAGTRLAQGTRDGAREGPRAARARAAADRRGRHPPGRRRPAARHRHGRAGAAGRRHRLPRRRQRLGRRAARARARLAGRRRAHPRRQQQGVRRLPAQRRRARDRRATARQEDRAALRPSGEAAQATRPLRLRPSAGALQRDGRRSGARRRRADRVRTRPTDHRRPHAVPRTRQGRDQAHPRRPRGQGGDAARRRRPPAPARRQRTR